MGQRRVLVFAMCVALLFLAGPTSARALAPRGMRRVTYAAATTPLANPERGWYHYIETRASAPVPYDLATLMAYRTAEQVTLLYCIVYLDGLTGTAIPSSLLQHLMANFATVRQAGLKCILRFAYTDDDPTLTGEQPPFGDAPPQTVAAHLAQLAPIIAANADVIAVWQAGFVGTWGEWYYTDHFVDDPSEPDVVSDAMIALRRQVIDDELAMVPAGVNVAVRYVGMRQRLVGSTALLPAAAAFGPTRQARIGIHNDCFLADATDQGTFSDASLVAERAYLAAESRYTPMGGESCAANPPRSACATALAELEQFHWTYLNAEYHPDVLTGWQVGGCTSTITRRLGYRLRLVAADLPWTAAPGTALEVSFTLANDGFAAPINPRPAYLVLRPRAGGAVTALPLTLEPRAWLPGTRTVTVRVVVPALVPPGDYELLLHLPDPAAALASRPEYAIQLANVATWEATTGYNRLDHIVTLTTVPLAPNASHAIPLVRSPR